MIVYSILGKNDVLVQPKALLALEPCVKKLSGFEMCCRTRLRFATWKELKSTQSTTPGARTLHRKVRENANPNLPEHTPLLKKTLEFVESYKAPVDSKTHARKYLHQLSKTQRSKRIADVEDMIATCLEVNPKNRSDEEATIAYALLLQCLSSRFERRHGSEPDDFLRNAQELAMDEENGEEFEGDYREKAALQIMKTRVRENTPFRETQPLMKCRHCLIARDCSFAR